ncbi:MAG: Formyltransferase family protein [Chitinophagaceae bacterium]|nr:Formyltransferase family protein [Chitinophagaceae bacterium]
MNIIILTGSSHGTAAHHLPLLIKSNSCTVAMVVKSQQLIKDKKKYYAKKIIKLFNIGFLGALNGIRMRKWYTAYTDKYLQVTSIEETCKRYGIPFYTVPNVNCQETMTLFKKAKADLGISLGNGYISEKIFSIPTFGMLNIHHELLPDYQNAQSVIWQIYNGSEKTGYTIHKVDKKIDGGEILYQEIMPIHFRNTFSDTVAYTSSLLLEQSAIGLINVLRNFNSFLTEAKPQGKAGHYTTPGIRQFIRMYRNYKRMKSESSSQ